MRSDHPGISRLDRLVPKQNSSGGKEKLGSIGKHGDGYLRSLFTAGALAVIRYAKIYGAKCRPLAHRTIGTTADEDCRNRAPQQDCRIAWAMIAKGERYNEPSRRRSERDRAEHRRDVM